MPFFSVVIPLYNKQNFVVKTIQSVLAQTFSDYEILIIDDCSTDKSLEFAESTESEKIRIIKHEQNKGLSASRNTGIKNAKSEFIAFLDADDTWKPGFLQKVSELIALFPQAGLFATAYEEVYPNAVAVEIHKNLELKDGEMALLPDFFESFLKQPLFCYSSVAVKKEVFETVGYFDQQISLGEDVDFNIRANLQYQTAYYNGICASYVIFSENQITTASVNQKKVTDFNKYETIAGSNLSLKRYLDLNRYLLAVEYKLAGNPKTAKKLTSEIDLKSLTSKQRLLLSAPVFMIKMLRKIKHRFLRKGVRLTTFRK